MLQPPADHLVSLSVAASLQASSSIADLPSGKWQNIHPASCKNGRATKVAPLNLKSNIDNNWSISLGKTKDILEIGCYHLDSLLLVNRL
jgi:hypothetical protein